MSIKGTPVESCISFYNDTTIFYYIISILLLVFIIYLYLYIYQSDTTQNKERPKKSDFFVNVNVVYQVVSL